MEIRQTLEKIDTQIQQCEDAAREPGNQAKPPDFEVVRVARSILLKAIAPVDRCQYMSDEELLKFQSDLEQTASKVDETLEEHGGVTLYQMHPDDDQPRPAMGKSSTSSIHAARSSKAFIVTRMKPIGCKDLDS